MRNSPGDKITIRQLTIPVVIGVNLDERMTKQDVIVDLELLADLREAASNDDLRATVDYSAVRESLIKSATETQFQLIESLASRMAETILRDFQVSTVTISLTKMPLDMPDTHSVSVSLTRHRQAESVLNT